MIKVIVQDPDWVEIGSFEAKKWRTITDLAQQHDVEIPFLVVVSLWIMFMWNCRMKRTS